VIRKWPYITTLKPYTHVIQKLPTKNTFRFKIFKKNTRFQNFSKSIINTVFIRNLVATQKRRTKWNKYVFTSYSWVKNFITVKKIINFLQYKLLYTFITPYPNISILKNTYRYSYLLGTGLYPINYLNTKPTIVKLIHIKHIFYNNTLLYKSKNNFKYHKLINTSYFNSLEVLKKLNNIGYIFKLTPPIQKNNKVLIYETLYKAFHIRLKSLRFIHIWLVLSYFVNVQ
jgi:hypothetical protein